MTKKNTEGFEEDSGQVIANMNVDGMPWYNKRETAQIPGSTEKVPMTREERRAYILAAIRSGLLILLVFAVVFFLFLLFCDTIWFR